MVLNFSQPLNVDYLKQLPNKPGVYVMRSKGFVLYVGKANDLKSRIRQYITLSDTRPQVPFLMEKVEEIETIVVTSEKEALLLESNLIKKYQPAYNVLLKDDKSFVALKVNIEHPWPKILLVRARDEIKKREMIFGPYPSAFAARKMLDEVHRLFKLRQCTDQELIRRVRPCILYDMGRCLAPCVKKCTPEEYQEELKKATRFIRGYNKEVIDQLLGKMEEAAEALEFEKAQEILDKIRAIEKTVEKQHVHLAKFETIDVWGLYREGESGMLTRLHFAEGELSSASHYPFQGVLDEDQGLLESALMQYYHQIPPPEAVLVPIPLSKGLEEILPITVPKRGDKVVLLKMAAENALEGFRQKRDKEAEREKLLMQMQDRFRLVNYPYHIECFDTSHMAGAIPTASMVVFQGAEAYKKGYRTYKIRTTEAGDDYQALKEVLQRRYRKGKEEELLPDLIIVDGGKGQLSQAMQVLKELEITTVDLISLVKEEARHDRGLTQEGVFLPGQKDPILLERHSSLLHFLQRVRDEAHRKAITLHKKGRSQQLTKSLLDTLPGIGPKRKKALLTHFGSLERLLKSGYEELVAAPSMTKPLAKMIFDWIQTQKEKPE